MRMTLAQFRARLRNDPDLIERMARAEVLPEERLPVHLSDAELAELVRRRAWVRHDIRRVEPSPDGELVYPSGWPPGHGEFLWRDAK